MNTQIHAYRDIPAICDKLRAIIHGAAEPTGGGRISPAGRTITNPRNHGEEIWNAMQDRGSKPRSVDVN